MNETAWLETILLVVIQTMWTVVNCSIYISSEPLFTQQVGFAWNQHPSLGIKREPEPLKWYKIQLSVLGVVGQNPCSAVLSEILLKWGILEDVGALGE